MKSNTELPSRTALVTGSSRGIGKAVALLLAGNGHRVAVNYRTHKDEAEAVVKTINEAGGESLAFYADVSVKSEVEAMFDGVEERFGPVEILVNNAGIISDSIIMRMKDEQFEGVINTNLMSVYYCTKRATPRMMKMRWGRIINVTSIVGIRGNPGQSNYSASKAAIHGFTKSIAKEFASRNITINSVAPGYVHTATSKVISPTWKKRILEVIPMKRFGTPEEIAPSIVFLTTEEARYITGHTMVVDGGLSI